MNLRCFEVRINLSFDCDDLFFALEEVDAGQHDLAVAELRLDVPAAGRHLVADGEDEIHPGRPSDGELIPALGAGKGGIDVY